jgi:hypothetical protein
VIGFLIGLIDPISRIVGQIAVARTEMAKAATDQERIHAQERVDTLEARKAVLIAESGSRVNGLIRAGFALPFVIYNIKLVMAGQATTDPLSAELYQVELACIGFYFLYEVTARLRR